MVDKFCEIWYTKKRIKFLKNKGEKEFEDDKEKRAIDKKIKREKGNEGRKKVFLFYFTNPFSSRWFCRIIYKVHKNGWRA